MKVLRKILQIVLGLFWIVIFGSMLIGKPLMESDMVLKWYFISYPIILIIMALLSLPELKNYGRDYKKLYHMLLGG